MLKELLRMTPLRNHIQPDRPDIGPSTPPPAEPPARKTDSYAAVAAEIGFKHPFIAADLTIEAFKDFLRRQDWGVFSLPTVIEYMDRKAGLEGHQKLGWEWHPLREKDQMSVYFGKPAFNSQGYATAASDWYCGPGSRDRNDIRPSPPYNKLVPLHALKKVALIEKEFKKPVKFLVADYVTAVHIEQPDPFLLAVIENNDLNSGRGRFVIDFWDEPGFGLTEQLA